MNERRHLTSVITNKIHTIHEANCTFMILFFTAARKQYQQLAKNQSERNAPKMRRSSCTSIDHGHKTLDNSWHGKFAILDALTRKLQDVCSPRVNE